jgi:hypothetical protein
MNEFQGVWHNGLSFREPDGSPMVDNRLTRWMDRCIATNDAIGLIMTLLEKCSNATDEN